jgi:hypothetical protein
LPDFTLPSGRVIQLKERASYGDLIDAQDAQQASGKINTFYVALEASLSGLTIDELRALDIEDGRALEVEMLKRAGKRSVEDEVPFGNPSSSPSDTSEQPSTPSPAAA